MEKKIDVSRYTNQGRAELCFDIEFITPTFLGGADGNAEIRTAPFKNLLRRWWRIANGNLSPEELWKKESRLFGSTEKDPDTGKIFGKSKVELKIEQPQSNTVYISSETEKSDLKRFLYLGYGPVQAKSADTRFYIKSGLIVSASIIVPKSEKDTLIRVLTLINLFGTVGSRSRKGFGSIAILPKLDTEEGGFKLYNIKKLREEIPYLHKGNEMISGDKKQYPYYLSSDEKGMFCWNTTQKSSYQEVLSDMTDIYRNVVGEAKKASSSGRTILGSANEVRNTEIKRIPSPLILKVVKQGDKYSGRILHLAYNISDEIKQQDKVWHAIYEYLDGQGLKRFGGAAK